MPTHTVCATMQLGRRYCCHREDQVSKDSTTHLDLAKLKESLFAQSAKRQENKTFIGRALARPQESCYAGQKNLAVYDHAVVDFSLALFQHKLHTILRLRKTSLGSRSTLKSCDLPAESGMPVLRTTTLVRICTQTRPYIPNGNIGTFSFGVECFSLNCTKRERSQENPPNPTFLPSQEQYKISKMCVSYSYFGLQEMD